MQLRHYPGIPVDRSTRSHFSLSSLMMFIAQGIILAPIPTVHMLAAGGGTSPRRRTRLLRLVHGGRQTMPTMPTISSTASPTPSQTSNANVRACLETAGQTYWTLLA